MFEHSLIDINKKLSVKNRNKDELYKSYVSMRLNKTIISYRNELESNIRYLMNRKPENVLKRM